MRKQICVSIHLDVKEAIYDLAGKYELSIGDLIEFMFHELGGKEGLDKRLRDRLLAKPQIQTQQLNSTTLDDVRLWAIFNILSEASMPEDRGW